MGRAGRWFAIEDEGVVPDLVTSAKSLGGGLPISAVTGPRRPHGRRCTSGGLGGTYGGNPVAAAAALAVLDKIEQEGLLDRVARRSARRSWRGCARCRSGIEVIGDVRGRGMMMRDRARLGSRDEGAARRRRRERDRRSGASRRRDRDPQGRDLRQRRSGCCRRSRSTRPCSTTGSTSSTRRSRPPPPERRPDGRIAEAAAPVAGDAATVVGWRPAAVRSARVCGGSRSTSRRSASRATSGCCGRAVRLRARLRSSRSSRSTSRSGADRIAGRRRPDRPRRVRRARRRHPVGSTFIDAIDRRKILIGAQVGYLAVRRASCSRARSRGDPPLALIYVAATAHHGVRARSTVPRARAMTPRLVGTELIPSALTLNQVIWNSTVNIVGPASPAC